jgi:hypothetical protein
VIGRRVRLEQALVAEPVRLGLGTADAHHQLAVLLGNHGRGRDQAGRVRAEQELRLVLGDQPRIQLLHAPWLRLVVVRDEAHLVVLVAGLDAACGVDVVAPHFESVQLRDRIEVERSRLRDGESDRERVLGGVDVRAGEDAKKCDDEQLKLFHVSSRCERQASAVRSGLVPDL